MRLILTFLILLSVQFSFAQNNKLGTWNIVNFKYNVDQKWSIWAESQTRSQLFFNNFFYYEIKGGLGYSIDKNFSLLLGTGRYATYMNDGNFKKPFANEEFRLWEQITMNQYLNRLKFEHRYRIEQRWLANGGYRNRFRYRLNTVLPLKNKRLDPKTFYLTAYDEVFLTNEAPYFERNRIFGGFGYKFNSTFVLQPGYIYQFDYRPDNTKSGKGFFQVALFIELEKQKSFHEKLPNSVD
ncbi:MAG: DUF2490 domain-containing protein [Bacteroidetes bacterium]|nr:DUF2490 domain-containing protein [Bacteroidota bacterium]